MAPNLELQAAIVAAVQADTALMALINGIYDRVPSAPWGAVQGYISFGPEDSITEADCVDFYDISIQLDVWSRQTGRVHCKQILHELRRVMESVETTENPIVDVGDPSEQIMRDPDGLTTHGFLQYTVLMEGKD